MTFLDRFTKAELQDQSGEFLHYAKRKLSREVQLRVQNRVDNLARGQLHPSCFPAGKQKSAVNPTSVCPPHSASVAPAQQVCPAPTPPCPRIGGFKHDDTIDWTHLDEVSPKETSSKCVQSMSRKRNTTLSVKSEQRTPKRVSPDRALYVSAVPVPMAIPLFSTPQPYRPPLPYRQPRQQFPQSIVDLWNRVDVPGRKRTYPCSCPTCPYITGAPMSRRYACMVALVNIENWLYFNR